MCKCIFSHTFYCCYKPLPVHWAFAVLWSFPFFSLSFIILTFLNLLYFLYIYSLVCLSYCSFPLAMYINLHLPRFNFAYLFFLFFLSFLFNIFVSFVFIALFPTWHLTLILFSSLCFS